LSAVEVNIFKSFFQKSYFLKSYHRLSIHYPKCLEPKVFQISDLFRFWNICICIMRYLGIVSKSKHKIHLCFNIPYTHNLKVIFYDILILCMKQWNFPLVKLYCSECFGILSISDFHISGAQSVII
jgi:hypothetical protein